MKRPPMLVTMKIRSSDGYGAGSKGIAIWIPLFIIVPIILLMALAFFLLVLPLLLAYVIVTWDFRWWRYLRYGTPALFEIMHGLPGLKVDVEDPKQKTYIDIN